MDYLFLGISLCTILLAFSSFFDKLPVFNRRVRWLNRSFSIRLNFHSKLWFRILFAIVVTVVSIYLTHHSSSLSDEQANKEIKARDSVNRKHEDSMMIVTADSMNKNFTRALNEYYLTYNANQKKVESLIRDSSSHEIPSFDIYPLNRFNISNDSLFFRYISVNTGNCSIKVRYNSFIGYFINNELHTYNNRIGQAGGEYPVGRIDTFNLNVDKIHMIDRVFLLFHGSYSGGKKPPKKIDNLYIWDEATSAIGAPSSVKYGDSIKFLMKKQLKIKG